MGFTGTLNFSPFVWDSVENSVIILFKKRKEKYSCFLHMFGQTKLQSRHCNLQLERDVLGPVVIFVRISTVRFNYPETKELKWPFCFFFCSLHQSLDFSSGLRPCERYGADFIPQAIYLKSERAVIWRHSLGLSETTVALSSDGTFCYLIKPCVWGNKWQCLLSSCHIGGLPTCFR